MADVDFVVPPEAIATFKQLASDSGFKVSYRARGGKQYITIRDASRDFQQARRKIIQMFNAAGIKYPWHTSGGMGEHTFRINPEQRLRQHIEQYRWA